MHRARAAVTLAAAELRARQADLVADDPEQRDRSVAVVGVVLTVDLECDHDSLLDGKRRSGTAAPPLPVPGCGCASLRPTAECEHPHDAALRHGIGIELHRGGGERILDAL